jgi:hypothetical protein
MAGLLANGSSFEVAQEAGAQDLVLYANPDGTDVLRVEGEVMDYTGQHLIIRRASGRRETLDSGRVRELDTQWGAECVRADERFAAREYAAARKDYQAAFQAERRPWAQRRIASQLVWCLRYTQQIQRAAAAFEWLYQSDPSTQYFDSIPLAWVASEEGQGFQGEQLLSPEKPAVSRLIAASWLLPTNRRPW